MFIGEIKTICDWCEKDLFRKGKRKYHPTTCARQANIHKMNVRQRLQILAKLAHTTIKDMEERAKKGCEACGFLSITERGLPLKNSPYPSYRIWRDHLVCPQCFRELPKLNHLSPKQLALVGRTATTPPTI